MKVLKLKDMKGGWFCGNFEPTAFKTEAFEASLKVHPKGEKWAHHFHRKVTEINLLVTGNMILQDKELFAGDIFIIEPFEIADPEFLTDCQIVCIKVPGNYPKDKVEYEINSSSR